LKYNIIFIAETGEKIEYDYLVIATGSYLELFPGLNQKQTIEKFKDESDKIRGAKRILVIGGGATGVELSGEIASRYPHKKVTLLHTSSLLVDTRLSHQFQKNLQQNLKSLNVNLILGDKLDLSQLPDTNLHSGPFHFVTQNGTEIEVDHFIVCVGSKLNTDWLKKSHSNVMNDKGQLYVNTKFLVLGMDNVFAIGDVTDHKEIHQSIYAQNSGEAVAENIIAKIKHRTMIDTPNNKPTMFVTCGSKLGVAEYQNFTFPKFIGNIIVSKAKGKDMWLGKFRKLYGQDDKQKKNKI